jgi:lysozyme
MGTVRMLLPAVIAVALAALTSMAAAGDRTRALGIDVSRFQEAIDWAQVGESEVRFAFVQASRGSGGDCTVKPKRCGADHFYERNYAGAKAVGIRVGAYHRAFVGGDGREEVRRDAQAEAELFAVQVGELSRGDLLPVLDVEAPFAGLDPGELRLWIRVWLGRVGDELGEKPMIYTSATSWQSTGDTARFARRGHRLWIAHWGVEEPSVPAEDWAGNGWSVWQYTNEGSVSGIDGRVDLNRLRVAVRRISVR